MSITGKLMEPFPAQAIKTRQGGGSKRLSYVEGHTVIHRLIAATGNQFDLRVLSVDQKGDLMTALVELTIPGLGSRQHMGVQKIAPNAGEDLVKGAITDAMKKAATLFGVGLELYGPDYGSDEDAAPPPANQPARQRAASVASLSASPTELRPAAAPSAAAGPPPPDVPLPTDDDLLVDIRNVNLDPNRRWDALWDYYERATTVAELNQRADVAYSSGMETRDLKAAYGQNHKRLSKLFAPASIAG